MIVIQNPADDWNRKQKSINLFLSARHRQGSFLLLQFVVAAVVVVVEYFPRYARRSRVLASTIYGNSHMQSSSWPKYSACWGSDSCLNTGVDNKEIVNNTKNAKKEGQLINRGAPYRHNIPSISKIYHVIYRYTGGILFMYYFNILFFNQCRVCIISVGFW